MAFHEIDRGIAAAMQATATEYGPSPSRLVTEHDFCRVAQRIRTEVWLRPARALSPDFAQLIEFANATGVSLLDDGERVLLTTIIDMEAGTAVAAGASDYAERLAVAAVVHWSGSCWWSERGEDG